MQDQAANLARVVSVFKLDDNASSFIAPQERPVSTEMPRAALRKETTVAPALQTSGKQGASDWEEF